MDESGPDRNESQHVGDAKSRRDAVRRTFDACNHCLSLDTQIDVTVRLWDQTFYLGVDEGADWRRVVAALIGELVQLEIEELEISDLLDAEMRGSPVRITSVQRRIQIVNVVRRVPGHGLDGDEERAELLGVSNRSRSAGSSPAARAPGPAGSRPPPRALPHSAGGANPAPDRPEARGGFAHSPMAGEPSRAAHLSSPAGMPPDTLPTTSGGDVRHPRLWVIRCSAEPDDAPQGDAGARASTLQGSSLIATAEWVDWCNHRRPFEFCDDLTPTEAETAHYAHHQPQQQPEFSNQ